MLINIAIYICIHILIYIYIYKGTTKIVLEFLDPYIRIEPSHGSSATNTAVTAKGITIPLCCNIGQTPILTIKVSIPGHRK